MGLLYYISYVAVVAAFAFVTLSLASGLLYVSELIEEHSRLAKLIGQRSIFVIIFLHVIFFFTDGLPPLQTIFSIACHVVYLQNFSATWPLISLTSPSFLASCVLVIADHFTWFFYFARITTEARHLKTYRGIDTHAPGFIEIASFFGICVWSMPLFLFLSLSANDNALPTSTAEPSSPRSPIPMQTAPTRMSLMRSIFSSSTFDGIPLIRPKSSRRDSVEGLLAPRSPAPLRSPMPHRASSPALRASIYHPPAPPRSPGPRPQELEIHNMATKNVPRLATPPLRRVPSRQNTADSVGLGINMRRTVSGHAKDD